MDRRPEELLSKAAKRPEHALIGPQGGPAGAPVLALLYGVPASEQIRFRTLKGLRDEAFPVSVVVTLRRTQ
jgi:hypothetical protein